MFIFDFVAETVLDQIIDWLYGKIVGFLNDFFAMMNNMGVELFDLPWVNAITTFFGWLGWAKNGEAAGTAGLAKRLEGIQIVLVPKNGKAPAMRYQGITSVKTQAYIKK